MKIIIPCDNMQNAYIPSLVNAYQNRGCEVITGVANFYQSNYQPDILHIQWPEALYLFSDFSIYGNPVKIIAERIKYYKNIGTIIIWTVHNIKPHETLSESADWHIYNAIIDLSDIIIHHGQASVEIMSVKYPQLKDKINVISPHGDYLIQHRPIDQSKARNDLNIPKNKTVILNFGSIRAYKGIKRLKQIIRGWKAKNKYLLIAGQPGINRFNITNIFFLVWNGIIRNRTSRAGYDLKHIPNDKVPLYFSACDIVLLTHSSGLNSGILAMSATFGKPVVYPLLGNFSEQMKGWISESYNIQNINSAIEALNKVTKKIASSDCLDNEEWLRQNSWEKHVDSILDAARHHQQKPRLKGDKSHSKV